jgi:hypothetical protein
LIPSIPDATAHLGKAAARWIRPLVPPFVARVIDNTTAPLHTARQVFEDVEEIAFSFKRTRKITVDTESSDIGEQPPAASAPAEAPARSSRIPSSRGERDRTYQRTDDHLGADQRYSSLKGVPPKDLAGLSLRSGKRPSHRELIGRGGPHELPSPEGPRQLPSAE